MLFQFTMGIILRRRDPVTDIEFETNGNANSVEFEAAMSNQSNRMPVKRVWNEVEFHSRVLE